MKTLIELHVLQNFAPSNLNRDDTGAPKDAFFGGTRRARVSSQCFKRAVREHFRSARAAGLFTSDELGVRTKRVCQEIAEQLKGKRDPAETAEKARTMLGYVKLKADSKDFKTQYLLFLGKKEISRMVELVDQYWDAIDLAEPAAEEGKGKRNAKKSKAGNAPKELSDALAGAFDGGRAVDVALFGRMLANTPERNQDAACQVAHAISTHAVEREFDFFTAVDDLKPNDTAGAGMMGTVEFNSACFYRYAVVDWDKLVENLHGDQALAAKGIRSFCEGFVVAEPTGKQNSFAAHNPPEFVALCIKHGGAPRSLANAFESAVSVRRGESLTGRSAVELARKGIALREAFGGNEEVWILNLTGASVEGFGTEVKALDALLNQGLDGLAG